MEICSDLEIVILLTQIWTYVWMEKAHVSVLYMEDCWHSSGTM